MRGVTANDSLVWRGFALPLKCHPKYTALKALAERHKRGEKGQCRAGHPTEAPSASDNLNPISGTSSEKPNAEDCCLISTHVPWHAYACIHIHTHANNRLKHAYIEKHQTEFMVKSKKQSHIYYSVLRVYQTLS